MHISRVQVERSVSAITLSTTVSPASAGNQPFTLWFRVPRSFEHLVDDSANAFAACLFMVAMKLGEDLTFDSPVSMVLRNNLGLLTQKIKAWPRTDSWCMQVRNTLLHAPVPDEKPPNAASNLGCFFSLGVDSFFTLQAVPHINHLLFVGGYDIPLDDSPHLAEAHRHLEDVADKRGKQCVIMDTNLREVTDRFIGWEMNHGAALAGAGLVLGNGLSKILISSSDSYITRAPYGTHPDIDPLWSTERTVFVPYGTEYKRNEKIRALSGDTLFQEHVRVCWKNKAGRYNCLACVKCLRTMLQLKVIGELEHVPTLNGPIPIQALDKVIEPRHRWFIWEDLLLGLSDTREDRAIAVKITTMLKRSRFAHFRHLVKNRLAHPFR